MKKLQKILCADDEADIRMLIKLSLENVGKYEVLVCCSGRELLENAERLNPDLIILDAIMPIMDGIQTLAELKEHENLRHIPVLFMTGKAKEAESSLLSAGAIAVLNKPFDPLHLADDIEKIWKSIQDG